MNLWIRKIISLADLPTSQKRLVGIGGNNEWVSRRPLGENAKYNNTKNNTVNKGILKSDKILKGKQDLYKKMGWAEKEISETPRD